jgi:hypothetical protein
MATSRKKASKAAAKKAARASAAPTDGNDMVFESEDFRAIPGGVMQVVFKVSSVGDDQSVSLGVGLFERLTPDSQWVVLAKRQLDNLPATPEESFFAFTPKAGASYAITFLGEMHALSLSNEPLRLALAVTAEGVGTPIEDFQGERKVNARFCTARGRALLKAKS